MNTQLIHTICSQLSKALGKGTGKPHPIPDGIYDISYEPDEIQRFVTDFLSIANQYNLTVVSSHIAPQKLDQLLSEANYPIMYLEQEGRQIVPVIAGKTVKGNSLLEQIEAPGRITPAAASARKPVVFQDTPESDKNGQVMYFTAFPMETLVSDQPKPNLPETKLTPVQRLYRLLINEKKDIGYIYLYAIVIGIITLSLPLGFQAIINLISGGMIFSSVYLLVGLVILGVLLTGILQIYQVTLVEVLQQRVFAKAAYEFTFRVPRIRTDALLGYYPPELMNRFFDVITVQKALPKILIEITGAILQIIFGILLLSFYHPFFIAFGLITFGILAIIIYFNGPKGLETSLVESKYKYKVVQWLEDIARSLYSFKLAGSSNLPVEKMDGYVNNYLNYRKKHFSVLLTFFWNAVGFKTTVIGGLLILGTVLVVNRQISLGQFVASEIVILLLTTSVEKLIQSIDVIFDALTAVEKLGTVTDLPLEKEEGFSFTPSGSPNGMALQVVDLSYKYKDHNKYTLKNLSFALHSGESLCITGANGSGKDTLLKVLSGLLTTYEGGIMYNGISLRDLNVASLRTYIEKNVNNDDIFEGSILENITLGRRSITMADLEWVINALKLNEVISKQPEGINTLMVPGGRRFSESFITKVTIARSIINRPRLLMINDLQSLERPERMRLVRFLTDKQNPWSLIIVSNNPAKMKLCDKVMVLQEGHIVAFGSYREVNQNAIFQNLVLQETASV
ncbi:ABC transporter ATP-binding protein [Telluribacter sp.]|jgi:ABC-type bacteriocin/lantibiotic exporter with double-glycine peptidase domain|uniref:peptidase domain-containing ABC transporter n=1 Tax=Telluribacter sp. TaxID=1978767 RepID=UPI002E10770A|nr:ABC transporter ATP-binding protein [Telluribacter sp.]